MVARAPEFEEFVAPQTRHAFQRPGQRSAQRMARPHGGGEQFLGDLRGLILVHQDFLADDPPLPLHLDRREARMLVKVGEHVAQLRQPPGLGLGEIAGVVLGGEGVQVAADGLDLAGDPPGGAAFGAFEKKVLQEVGRAVEPGGFVPSAHRRPQPDAHAGHVRHFRRGDAQAVGERGQVVHALDDRLRVNRCRASSRSCGYVILRLKSPLLSSETPWPACSRAEVSSVTLSPASMIVW